MTSIFDREFSFATRVKKIQIFGSRIPFTLLIGSFILFVYFIVAITGRFWAPYGYSEIGVGPPLAKPNISHPFGTDSLGRDVFSRVIHGTDEVLFTSLASSLLATISGGLLGLFSGFFRGWFDEILMRIFELMVSIPVLIFALLIITAAGLEQGGSQTLLIIIVALVWLPRIGRMARATAVGIVTRDFVTVARARGESAWSIIWRELLPNATGVLLVEFGVRFGYGPILVGGLGFLGFGMRPPTPEWGMMISEYRVAITSAPTIVLAPAIALSVLVIGLNIFTDGLARIFGRQVQYRNQ